MGNSWYPDEPRSRRANGKLTRLLAALPAAQFRVATALVADGGCPTYKQVAENLDLSLASVYTHLRRIRLSRPQIYAALTKERKRQLKVRHRDAVKRARAHTFRWHRITSYRYLWFDPREPFDS